MNPCNNLHPHGVFKRIWMIWLESFCGLTSAEAQRVVNDEFPGEPDSEWPFAHDTPEYWFIQSQYWYAVDRLYYASEHEVYALLAKSRITLEETGSRSKAHAIMKTAQEWKL